MRAATIEHAEILDAEIGAIGDEIEAIHNQELPVLRELNARRCDAGGRGAAG